MQPTEFFQGSTRVEEGISDKREREPKGTRILSLL
jgi:hypothetical protein